MPPDRLGKPFVCVRARGPRVCRFIPGLTGAVARSRLEDVPRPDGHDYVFFRNPTRRRVLLIGSGPAVGWGVLTHQLGLAGELSRVLTAETSMSVGVRVLARAQMNGADLTEYLKSLGNLSSYHAIVVTTGVNDAIARTRVRRWETHLAEALDVIEAAGVSASSVVLVGIQRFESVPAYLDMADRRAEERRLLLNQASGRVAAAKDARVVQLPARQMCPGRYPDRRTYRVWADAVAAVIPWARPPSSQ